MSDEVPGIAEVLVGGVFHIGNVVAGQVRLDFPPLSGEQWSDDVPTHRRDAAQSTEPTAPHQVEQYRLAVVLGVVGSGDAVGG